MLSTASQYGGGSGGGTGETGGGNISSPLSPLAQATIEKHLPGLPTKRLLHQQSISKVQKRDAACITDVHSSEHLPEVEIFSLLEEQIPKYKIRADSLTQFGGYENEDWFIPCPALPIPPEGLGLSKDMCRETLNYFLLSGNRVSQMTRTYDDIEAVSRLLEEKEKDLELTVQIGKELLTQNNRLETRVSELELEIKTANENLAQLSHELHQKNELVAILTNDVDDSSENATPTATKSINLDLLQRKIHSLEDENKSLKMETAQIAKEFDEVEEHERRLVADITNQLQSTSNQYEGLSLELERYKEENRLQHEQIINLTSRLAESEIRLHQITSENEEQSSLLIITKENQNLLASELAEFKARYQEVLALLQEAQEQMRKQRKRGQPTVRSSLIPGYTIPQVDSLQSELMESSLYSDNSLDSGIALDRGLSIGGIGAGGLPGQIPSYKKVFETVRCATKSGHYSDGISQLGAMSMSSSYQPRMSSFAASTLGMQQRASSSSVYAGTVYSNSSYPSYDGSMGAKTHSRESLISDSEDSYPGPAGQGIPGVPGAKDLEAALKRLTPAEVLARRAMLSHAPAGTYSYDEVPAGIPLGCRTPDSIMSTGSSGLSGLSSHQWRLPEKLQIVKPMEGSQTLHHWSRLATPTLSGLLDERPGVKIRGGRDLDELGLQIYSLSDVEEDAEEHPGKRFQISGCVYTYTNCTVLHPDDGTSVTFSMPQSQMSSQVASECNSRQSTAPPTPRQGMSRRNSCSTFSVNLGLASMLNERGIKAVTPSALNTPAGANFSPTVTPCNSPEGSPLRSESPEPQFLAGFLSSGADILRRKLVGSEASSDRPSRITTRNKLNLTRLERRALRSIKILEKVESLGLENVIGLQQLQQQQQQSGHPPPHGISPLAMQGTSSVYNSRTRTASPMAQLTSLKNFQQYSGERTNEGNLIFDKETIRAVLSKGLSNDSLKSLADNSIAGSSSSSSGGGGGSSLSEAGSNTFSDRTSHHPSTSMGVPAQPGSGAIDARIKQMQRQKSRRSLLTNGNGSGQRSDLGTVTGTSSRNIRRDLGTVVGNNDKSSSSKIMKGGKTDEKQQPPQQQQTITQGFVGTISSLLFGRKGGLL